MSTFNLPLKAVMNLNKRDHHNLSILILFQRQAITEQEAFSQMKLDHKRSEKSRNKYLKQLIKFIQEMEYARLSDQEEQTNDQDIQTGIRNGFSDSSGDTEGRDISELYSNPTPND